VRDDDSSCFVKARTACEYILAMKFSPLENSRAIHRPVISRRARYRVLDTRWPVLSWSSNTNPAKILQADAIPRGSNIVLKVVFRIHRTSPQSRRWRTPVVFHHGEPRRCDLSFWPSTDKDSSDVSTRRWHVARYAGPPCTFYDLG